MLRKDELIYQAREFIILHTWQQVCKANLLYHKAIVQFRSSSDSAKYIIVLGFNIKEKSVEQNQLPLQIKNIFFRIIGFIDQLS